MLSQHLCLLVKEMLAFLQRIAFSQPLSILRDWDKHLWDLEYWSHSNWLRIMQTGPGTFAGLWRTETRNGRTLVACPREKSPQGCRDNPTSTTQALAARSVGRDCAKRPCELQEPVSPVFPWIGLLLKPVLPQTNTSINECLL